MGKNQKILINMPKMVEVLTVKYGATTAVIGYILKKHAKYKAQLLDYSDFEKKYNLSKHHLRNALKNLKESGLITINRDKFSRVYYKWATIDKLKEVLND